VQNKTIRSHRIFCGFFICERDLLKIHQEPHTFVTSIHPLR
jgi:hypothetical protein